MTKDEWIWVAIRIFGIFLLVLAIMAIPKAAGAIYGYVYLSAAVENSNELQTVISATQKAAMASGIRALTSVLLYFPLSYYFIKHGKWLHKVASNTNA